MSFTCYAENFEDVMLWRALRGVADGFYIDVGAGDPRRASVTCALYERGWRGLNLEPAPGLLRRLQIERPADINLGVAAAGAPGSAPFYEVAGSLESTFDAALAQQASAAGQPVLLRQATLDTLDALCAAHAPAAIHLLKVDTGADAQAVFDGFDLQRWQPWIIVADTARGGGAGANGWQHRLAAAGYTLAYADGQNAFYVAPAQRALAAALALPPHPADDFVLCEGHPYSHPLTAWQERSAAAEAAAEEARAWAKAHVREWQQKHALLEEQQTLTRRAQAELAAMTQRAAAAEGQIPPLTARAVQCGVVEQELAAVYASRSWRITRPLREASRHAGRAKGALRRLLGKLKPLALRLVKALLRRAMQFVLTRPKLAFFVRRQAQRHPGLLRLARSLVLRGQQPAGADAPPASAELAQLPEAAQQVFRDLHRARP